MDPYCRLAHRELYRNPWLALEVHEVLHPTGVAGEHLLIVTPAASAALAIDGGDVILTRQPRFGARNWVIEVVKGGAQEGETPLACAQRELQEEVGLGARRWEALGSVMEIPSLVASPVSLFIARDVYPLAGEQEEVEKIDVYRIPLAQAYAAALDGRIDDAVTLAALLRYRLIADS
jgi:8-oxo-dGTP pyrophosphatase MutT (NUDIX family)